MEQKTTIEKEIELLSDVIRAAIFHGGDAGGAYYSDWFGLETALGNWIAGRGLEGQYIPVDDALYLAPLTPYPMCGRSAETDRFLIAVSAEQAKAIEAGEPAVSRRPGVPLSLHSWDAHDSGDRLLPSFDSPRGKSVLFDIDYRQAEAGHACTFYKQDGGGLFAYRIPAQYLKRIRTPMDDIEDLVKEAGYYVHEAVWKHIVLRREAEPRSYISLQRDGGLSSSEAVPDGMAPLLQQVRALYF